jgi:N-acetylmuramoyl-L-alanine amidase
MQRKLIALLTVFFTLFLYSSWDTAKAHAAMPDIPEKYQTELEYLMSKEVIQGYPDNTFRPDKIVSRQEAATMIGRSIELDGTQRDTSFPDVEVSSYASGYIESAREKGIINGYGDGSFQPDRQITRGEMAFMIANAFNLSETSGVVYNDVPTSGQLYKAINLVSTAGIANGYPGGAYKPNAPITRAEFSLLVSRSLNPTFRVQQSEVNPIGEKVVSTYELNVRKGPGTEYSKVGLLNEGNKVTIYNITGDWAYISYGSLKGYVHTAYLKTPGAKMIAIDAGHGGHDPGASANGLVEKEINLDIAKRVQAYLENADINVVMTRTDDTFVSLDGRVDYAVNKKADTFLSIHTNSFSSGSANGTETYYSTAALNPRAEASKKLATFIQKRLVAAWGTSDRGVKNNSYRVIYTNPLPAALVELGFITNSSDANKLGSDQHRQTAAKAIYLGILDYYEWKE